MSASDDIGRQVAERAFDCDRDGGKNNGGHQVDAPRGSPGSGTEGGSKVTLSGLG